MTPTMSDIASTVATRFQISTSDLLGRSRLRSHAWPRQIVMLLASEMTNKSGAGIARYLHRDHTSHLFGVRAAKARILADPEFAAQVECCRALVIHRPSWKIEAARSIRENGLALNQAQA